MTATILRLMRVEDLPGVNALLIRAFSTARRDEGFSRPALALCRMEFLRFYQQDTPGSCWVAEAEGRLCGVVFGHGWGRAGWIGPLAVSTECQKRGLGRALLERCADELRGLGCRLVGLETDPASLNNLAFYSVLGCTPGPLLVDLVHEIEPGWVVEAEPLLISYGQEPAPFESHLPAFLEANGVEADYLHLARLLQQHRFGESWLEMEGDQVRLFAALQMVPVSVQERAGVGRIMAVVGPGGTGADRLEAFIHTAAARSGCSHVVVRLSTWHMELLAALLRRGWRLINSHLRFYITGGEKRGNGGMHLNKWD